MADRKFVMTLMKLPAAAIQCSDLLNLPVLDRNTAKTIGRVAQLWLDVETHQMVGLTCKSGLLGRQDESFAWTQVEIYGTKRVVVQPGDPPAFHERESVEWAFWQEVWTAAGKKVGSIADYRIDAQTGIITQYLLAAGGGLGIAPGMYELPTRAIVRATWQGFIADEAGVQSAPRAEAVLVSPQMADRLVQCVDKQRREEERMRDALLLLQQLVEREETTVKAVLDCLYDVGSVNLIDSKVSAKSLNHESKSQIGCQRPKTVLRRSDSSRKILTDSREVREMVEKDRKREDENGNNVDQLQPDVSILEQSNDKINSLVKARELK